MTENETTDLSGLRGLIEAEAYAAGFDAIAITSADGNARAEAGLRAFVANGHHGDMEWMQATLERRVSPHALWPEARSIIMLAMTYAPDTDPIATAQPAGNGVISCYARGKDYHDIVKPRLKRVARLLAEQSGAEVKVFVDTAPVMEKPLGAAAGLGWQGKHTNLVSRELGSWFFLGAIFTTVEFPPDRPETDHCGSCRRCLDACPTNAFPAPYQLDARRCISYLTIEHKGQIPRELRPAIGNRIYGCDDCLAVCPWNKYAIAGRDQRLAARSETDNPPLAELLTLDDAQFRTRFAGTPVKRTGRDRFVRNVLVAAGNSRDQSLRGAVVQLIGDDAPLVRAMAVWAAARLFDVAEFAELAARHQRDEADAGVMEEWRHAPAATSQSGPRSLTETK